MKEKVSLEQLSIKSFATSIATQDQHIRNGYNITAPPTIYSACCSVDCPTYGNYICPGG